MANYTSSHTGSVIDNVVSNALLKTEASSIYLTQSNAANTYLTQSDASLIYTPLTSFNAKHKIIYSRVYYAGSGDTYFQAGFHSTLQSRTQGGGLGSVGNIRFQKMDITFVLSVVIVISLMKVVLQQQN